MSSKKAPKPGVNPALRPLLLKPRTSRKLAILEATSPVIAILFAMVVASVALIVARKNPITAYAAMFSYSFGRLDSIATILYKATPLIFSGLAVAIGFRVNLFNIGVNGQYYFGSFCAAVVGFSLKGLPAFIHLPLVILTAMAGGALWALVPIWLKIKRGVHEVITTIMLNSTAFLLVHYFVAGPLLDKTQVISASGAGSPRMRMPLLQPSTHVGTIQDFLTNFGITLPGHLTVNWFLFIGILAAIGFWYLMWRTPFGMELRAVGHNPKAAETAGVNVNKVLFQTFLLSGAVAGLVGLSDLLGYFGYFDIDFPQQYGFTGIAVALVGKNGALGIVLAALLFGFLSRGGMGLQVVARVPMETYYILQGLIILCIVVASEVIRLYTKAQQKKEEASADV